jgi:ATP-dependent helicase/nuclease subunit A
MTRARDTLILSGGISQNKWDELWKKPVAVTPRSILSARSFADWLAIWFGNQSTIGSAGTLPVGASTGGATRRQDAGAPGGNKGELPNLRWRIVDDVELAGDSARGSRGDEAQTEMISEPPHVGHHEYDGAAEKVRARLEWNYPFKAATKRKAKSSVTELRRTAQESDEEAEQVFQPRRFSTKRLRGKLSAAEAGAAHHQFLQHVTLEKTGDRATLAMEAQRLERENILSAEEHAVLDLEAVADFWDSLPGRRIRSQSPDSVKRELPFTAKFSPAELAEITGAKAEAGLENEFVVVQGVVDLAVLLPEEIWLVDFKTDEVRADELPEKTKLYEPQLKLYARALAKIYSRPVTHGWLHFLDGRKTVDVKI